MATEAVEHASRALFGQGDLDRLDEATLAAALREASVAELKPGTPDGIVDLDGVEGVDADLIVRPFSRKGVFTSLRQFTINALNVHHGMEASERFGVRWTGTHDFDESGVPDAVTPGDVTALVAFQATLPPPTVKRYPFVPPEELPS